MRAFGVYGCMGPSRGPRVGSDRPPTTGPPPHLSNPLASQKRPSKPIELSEREIQDARTGRRAGLGVGVGRLSWETRGRCGRGARRTRDWGLVKPSRASGILIASEALAACLFAAPSHCGAFCRSVSLSALCLPAPFLLPLLFLLCLLPSFSSCRIFTVRGEVY